MNGLPDSLVGTWRLVHSTSIGVDGTTEYPFGEDAIGYIYYGDTGIMAVQISRRVRASNANSSDLPHEYLAYFGPYEVDVERSVVRHFVEGQLFPGDHPSVLERRARFDGDRLSLRPLDGTNREILWERVKIQGQ
jgi:hypothetical protein